MTTEKMAMESQRRRRNRLALWILGTIYFILFASSFLRVGL